MESIVLYVVGAAFSFLITVIGYFLKNTMVEFTKYKEHMTNEVDLLKEKSAMNKAKIEMLESESNLKYSHMSQKLEELYGMLRDLIIEVKDINKRIK